MSSKDIKDYLHLYLGCNIQITEHSSFGASVFNEKLIHVTDETAGTNQFEYWFNGDNDFEFKPILRPLSDITEEEMNECWFNMEGAVEVRCEYKDGGVKKFDSTPAQVAYLLFKGFDLFGLIDEGLAIDATKQLDENGK